MRPLRTLLGSLAVIGLLVGGFALADSERGKAAGASVAERYGSPDAMEGLVFQPLASQRPMQTMDGKEFDAKLECPGQLEFLRVSMVPSSANDLQLIGIEIDRDLDGTRETATTLAGPFAAVCTNGALRCDPGTTTNCRGRRWRASNGTITTDDVDPDRLGGCYCFNNSCGAGLLGVNGAQVLGDLGTGVATALHEDMPRLSVGRSQRIDATTMAFYGQSSGCAADTQPEQYFRHPEQIQAAGLVAGSNPDSLYSRLATSDAASERATTEQHCTIRRAITLEPAFDLDEVLSLTSGAKVAVASCGERCIDITLGEVGNNYWDASCGHEIDEASWTIHQPNLIESAILTFTHDDDWLSVVFDGTQLVWSDPPNFDGTTANCSVNHDRGDAHPNVDMTAYLRAKAPGSTWTWRNTTWWDDKGEGYAVMRLQFAQDCTLSSEVIDDGCGALQANVDCAWRDETVDGVSTYRNYYATGLSPLPSKQDVTAGSCRKSFTRDFWTRDRTYTCKGTPRTYDPTTSTERYQVVSSTFDPATGQFEDLRTSEDGTQTRVGMTAPLPPPQENECQSMCKTRKPRAGQAMGENGSTGLLNPSTPAWDYTYRDCATDNVCPLGPGEEIVSACNCSSSFFEAVSIMQTIRMTAQDTQCVAP